MYVKKAIRLEIAIHAAKELAKHRWWECGKCQATEDARTHWFQCGYLVTAKDRDRIRKTYLK